MNKCLSIQMILAQYTKYKKRKQQRIALHISTVEAFIAGVGEVSLRMACIPIHGKSLKMSLSPSALMNLQQRKARSMTAGAATIVPYMYSEVTMETTVKDRTTFPKRSTFSQADTVLPWWKTYAERDFIINMTSSFGKTPKGLSRISFMSSTSKLNSSFRKVWTPLREKVILLNFRADFLSLLMNIPAQSQPNNNLPQSVDAEQFLFLIAMHSYP